MHNAFTTDQVKLIETAPTAVALMEHRGHPHRLGGTIQRFIAWRKAAGLTPKTSATFTIFHDPEPANADDFHIDLCAATDRKIAADDKDVNPEPYSGCEDWDRRPPISIANGRRKAARKRAIFRSIVNA